MNDWKSQFKEWLKEIIPWEKVEDYVQFARYYPEEWGLEDKINVDTGPNLNRAPSIDKDRIKIRVFTKNNLYGIVATEKYLGCTVSTRKPRAGEDWTRGHDLSDGRFSRKTWKAIKNRIIAYELVRVAKPREEVADRVIEAPSLPDDCA